MQEDWTIETASRRVMGSIVGRRVVEENDCIVFPDLDELLHPRIIRSTCKRLHRGEVARFHLMWYYTSMWQLALPNAWKVNGMVLASTLRDADENLDALRATKRNLIDIDTPPLQQCEGATPVGWHCTWCFQKSTRRSY